MSFRSLGAKVLNNAKIFVNTQSTVSQQIINSENNECKQNAENNNINDINKHCKIKRINCSRKKKRQRMHFRPIIPQHYICPITQELMTDPVIVSSGHTFERTAIIEWFEDGNTINPLTGQPLQNIDIKPNYALKDAIREYRRKLADELFRITFDENKNEEILHYRDNILFSKDTSNNENEKESEYSQEDKLLNNNENDIKNMNEYDGYISDDEQELDDLNSLNNIHISFIHENKNKKKKKKYINNNNNQNINDKRTKYNRNIPIIAFLGPNNTGKSTLLNLIVGEPVFVTMDELSDYDTLSKVVRFKIVTRADREFILLDVEGLFSDQSHTNHNNIKINDSVLKIFFAVYSIASVIVWNDTNENNPYLQHLLQKADIMLEDINNDGEYYFRPYDIKDMNNFAQTPNGGLLPEELRQFLLKKYKKLTKKLESKCGTGGINIGKTYTHKPAFIILRRDVKQTHPQTLSTPHNNANITRHNNQTKPQPISPWLSSDTEHKTKHSSPSLFSLSSVHHLPPFMTESHTDSQSATDLSPSPRLHSQNNRKQNYNKINYQILCRNNNNNTGGSSGNDSAVSISNNNNTNQSLSIVDELKEDKEEIKQTHEIITNINLSDSSALMDNLLNHSIIYGNNNENDMNMKLNKNISTFRDYLQRHNDFYWLRQLNLFSYMDGIVLHKLDENDEELQDDSLLSILPKLDGWINEWCQYSTNVIPIVRNNKDMLLIVEMINKNNTLSSTKFVEQCMQFKGSRLQRYFYYNNNERTLNELKLIAERFKWDNKNLIRWFIKHFNRLWYHIKDFPNSHYALLYESLFYQYYLNNNQPSNNISIIPTIILNFSHFYYQISNKVDLYRDIVDRTATWGEFAAGAVSGLGSLSLMSAIHPLVGVAAVPFSIHFASSLGNKSGAKVGDAIAYSKAHFVDQTERYDLGKIDNENENEKNKNENDEIVYCSCYHSDNSQQNNQCKTD